MAITSDNLGGATRPAVPSLVVPVPSKQKFGTDRRTVVQLVAVTKSYGDRMPLALQATSLDILQGEFFSLLGPSGSGKTTTLRLIGGFEPASGGRILLDGEDVTAKAANLRDVNTVFQNYALFPHLSVGENISYPLNVKKVGATECTARVRDAVAMVEMTGFEKRLPHELSGGQRQRVALARALVGRPKVLLLDEPLGALDLRLRQQMQSVLTHLQRELGITFIYVTHDHGEALAMSDRIAVMADGRIRQIGTPRDIYYQPTNRFVANFIGNSNVLDGRVEEDGLHFDAGQLRLELPHRAKIGLASVSVRSENVEVIDVASSQGSENEFDALVEEVVFLGEVSELRLIIGGQRLTARVPANKTAAVSDGATVKVGIHPESIVVLHD